MTENPRGWGTPFNLRDPRIGLNAGPDSFGCPHGRPIILLGDGSVRMLNENVSPGVFKALGTPAGASGSSCRRELTCNSPKEIFGQGRVAANYGEVSAELALRSTTHGSLLREKLTGQRRRPLAGWVVVVSPRWTVGGDDATH